MDLSQSLSDYNAQCQKTNAHFVEVWASNSTADILTDKPSLKTDEGLFLPVTSGDAKPKYSQSHVPPAKLQMRKRDVVSVLLKFQS